MELGVLAGFPVVDVKVTLYGGSSHETDSNEMAFQFAASIAFKEAARRSGLVILEPMMAIEITEVPEELTGRIRSEIGAHRGRVELEETTGGWTEMKAVVPLSELLVSASSTLVEFPMEFTGYEAVQDNDSQDENGAGVTANEPNRPRPGSRSAKAQRPPEWE